MNTSSRGRVEKPGETPNVAWQTRNAEPTAFENQMGDALEQAFAADALELGEVVEHLKKQGCKDPQGNPWTEASLQEWLRQRA